ncbi:hypothetical protein DRQ09_00900 [candidate division KSB1 bacterium]|nr:MAG: hypothetical protein DRQ09_00900 [candidate division KSB1 bacterium]
MSIGILFESREWSNLAISKILTSKGIDNELIDVSQFSFNIASNFNHNLYWNRIFPSLEMRNHHLTLHIINNFLFYLNETNVPVVNSYKAFFYDFNKIAIYKILKEKGFNIPETTGINSPDDFKKAIKLSKLPFVLKRNRSGRAWSLEIINNKEQIENQIKKFPLSNDFWLVQEYIPLKHNYVTRIEIVGDNVLCILKRFPGSEGISSYSRGSSIKLYKNFPIDVVNTGKKALNILDIEMGSIDIIESIDGKNYIIDVNATTNFTPDYIDLLGFNPLERMCDFVIKKYKSLKQKSSYE